MDRKGKPSGNCPENQTLQEAVDEAQEADIDTSELEVLHANRHLHKGEEIKTYKDKEE